MIQEDRSTRKVWIVFHASSRAANAKSFNQNLECGANLDPDLVGLLLDFTQHRVAMIANIEKAFLQIPVNEEDRGALRFLWYETVPKKNCVEPKRETCRMARVSFGATSGSFLIVVI